MFFDWKKSSVCEKKVEKYKLDLFAFSLREDAIVLYTISKWNVRNSVTECTKVVTYNYWSYHESESNLLFLVIIISRKFCDALN